MITSADKIWKQVETSLDGIRPYLERDGGNVVISEITNDMVVKVKLVGACENCPQSYMTMNAGIEESIKRDVPEIKAVVALNLIK